MVNEKRKKLSKRRDDVSLADYMNRGYLPEAMVNTLSLLGWGPADDVEIRPIEEIIEMFSLESVNKAAAFFDVKKLDHINNAYIRDMSSEDFAKIVGPFMVADDVGYPASNYDPSIVVALASEIQQRISTLSEAPRWVSWLFVDEIDTYDEKSWKKSMLKGRESERVLDEVIQSLADDPFDDPESIEAAVMAVGARLSEEVEARVMSQAPVRVALTGHMAGIPLWQAMTLLGHDKCIGRLEAARARLRG